MKKLLYISVMVFLGFFTSCESLDVPPQNILTDDDVFTEGGIKAYMTGLYNRLPMDDFNTSNDGNLGGYYNWNSIYWPMLSTGETVNRNSTGIYIPAKGYWEEGYKIIRNTNYLLEELPAYEESLIGVGAWIAEAKFIRAYVYFQLVKRYGGVPIVDEPQKMTDHVSELWVARSSHEECYDFILEDLDYAIEHMDAKEIKGRANKYVAAAFKSRVAVFAGSVARYGGQFAYTVDGVQLCGIPATKANTYFEQAWKATKVVEQGSYDLYKGNSDLVENFAEVFAKADNSKESIFIRQYDFSNYVHSFDAVYSPPRMTSTYGDRYNVTLDWVELFDGLPLDAATGRIKTVDDNNNYIVYKNEKELFENAEPRLKGSVLIPGHTYKGVELDIRRGVIKEEIDPSTTIQKMSIDDGNSTAAYGDGFFKDNILVTTENVLTQSPYELSTGVKVNKNGLDGPANGGSNNTLTGFHGRKWLNMSLTPSATKLHESHQTWIDIRYAEVLLNRAEAALELSQNEVKNIDGVNLQEDAYWCVNEIRGRAGADLLTSATDLSVDPANERGAGQGGFVMAPNRGLQLIRVERYKELAFEHKIYWDLRRWYTFDKQIYNYRRRMLNPFMFAKGATLNQAGNPVGKYIYDARVCERANNNLTFQTKFYYEAIPGGQIKSNPLLEQNAQY